MGREQRGAWQTYTWSTSAAASSWAKPTRTQRPVEETGAAEEEKKDTKRGGKLPGRGGRVSSRSWQHRQQRGFLPAQHGGDRSGDGTHPPLTKRKEKSDTFPNGCGLAATRNGRLSDPLHHSTHGAGAASAGVPRRLPTLGGGGSCGEGRGRGMRQRFASRRLPTTGWGAYPRGDRGSGSMRAVTATWRSCRPRQTHRGRL